MENHSELVTLKIRSVVCKRAKFGCCSAPYRIFYCVLFHFNFELPQLC